MMNAYATQQNPLQDADFAPGNGVIEPRADEQPAPARRAAAPRQKRQLNESASLDEEEFQDCKCLPI